MGIRYEPAGFDVDGVPVGLYHLENEDISLVVTNLGAAARSLYVKDGEKRTDVLLGFEHPKDQLEKGPMFGVTLGRYAGKILGAEYEARGVHRQLTKSHGEHHAHGGRRGFDKRVFETIRSEEDAVTFRYVSADGEEGYPGELTLFVTYRLEGRRIFLTYEISADQDTVAGISNHMYLNLAGCDGGEVTDQEAFVRAERISEPGADGLPAGRESCVAGTPMDLRTFGRIGAHYEAPCEQRERMGGFDHDYLLDDRTGEPAAGLYDPASGRRLLIYADSPCIHFYIPDFGGMRYPGKGGAVYDGKCGVCFEPMYVSDCLHSGIGASPRLLAGERRVNQTVFEFSW